MKYDDDYPHEEERMTLLGAFMLLVSVMLAVGIVAWVSSAPQFTTVVN